MDERSCVEVGENLYVKKVVREEKSRWTEGNQILIRTKCRVDRLQLLVEKKLQK